MPRVRLGLHPLQSGWGLNHTAEGLHARAVRSLSEPRCPRRGASPALRLLRPVIARGPARASLAPLAPRRARRGPRAARSRLRSRPPAESRLSGSFQTALGCPADFDPTCPQTQLQDNRDGSWSAVLPVPPGDYVFRVVASSDAERRSGEGGDPNGADIPLSVPGDAAGVYFRYDSLTGEIVAEPVASAATLVTDLGEQFAMAPAPRRRLRGDLGRPARELRVPGSLQWSAGCPGQRQSGQSQPGHRRGRRCRRGHDQGHAARHPARRHRHRCQRRSPSRLLLRDHRPRWTSCAPRAATATMASSMGCCALRVPNGLEDGNYTLRETFTPEGGTPAEDQRIELGAGRFEAVASDQPKNQPLTSQSRAPRNPRISRMTSRRQTSR